MLNRLSKHLTSLESKQPHLFSHRIIRRTGQSKDKPVAIFMWHMLDAIRKAGTDRW